ncbi:hypothetical protein C8R48DRAFT_740886 [Suillus tomentosus]|nr:hypothetical protein C8R48DRAFT_740886 [Suillus tomentosus]
MLMYAECDNIKVHPPADQSVQQCHAAIVIGRNHFINSHGENCVRLAFEQTIHPYAPSLLIVMRWNTFNSNLNGQLQDSTLLATVLLNANVGLLAINSVDTGGRSPVQYVLGLLLVSHNRTMGQLGTVLQTFSLSQLGEKERRLERLAIIYSLPKTLLMWGMIFFFAAFSVHWWDPGNQTTRAVVGSVIILAFVMILYGIMRAKYGGDHW